MPAVQAIAEDPQELRRSLRDLVAVSMLPATWVHHDAEEIAHSVAEVLIRMLDLEFASVALQWGGAEQAIQVVRVRGGAAPARAAAVRHALTTWLAQPPPGDVLTTADPGGTGSVRLVFSPIAVADKGTLVTASRRSDFPTAAQRLLLGVAANQAAIAIRRWQAEQALQRLNDTLEQRVAAEIDERMRVEEAYRQAQKMEAIGQLTGGIAHDFNNLLGAVLGSLRLLRKRLADDSADLRLVDGAIEGAERGVSLTQRLLAFARRQDLRPAAVDAAELICGVITMLRGSIGPMVAIESELATDLWQAHVDANQLELALLNLALNARDAMPEGGRLRLGARNATLVDSADDGLAPGDYVCLTVTDDGAGMDEATLARAADPFFTTKGVGKGTGLGLSMVQGVAAQSRGALRLASRSGSGTTAELWLPRAKGPPAITALPLAAAPAQLRPCTILLVDDDALISMATSEMLKDLGHRVIEAPSGGRALEILGAGAAVDVVITDQAMPGMTGTQLAARIRAAWPDLPVIIATGYAELPEDRDRS
ncbi:MAG TPA: ATP-binding protein, partial [Geminicoccaceae bacterium]|nr:ATP-binding protein [Geminicoccaceae bacterium]